MSRTILITGASSGFGRDTAETLARAGHRVFASMRGVTGRNRPHAEALRAKGIDVVEIDVTDDAVVEQGVASVLALAGRLDVLVNNAGIGSAGVSEAFTTDQLRTHFDVNVLGVQRTLRAALPAFRRQGDGLVVNMGSVLGRLTLPFMGLYCATKFAIEALNESYRYELSQAGVDVVLMQPSFYPTNIFASAMQPGDPERIAAYGEVAAIPDRMVEQLAELFRSENAPNPHDVAEAIARIVAQPNGSRPARVVVGRSYGADAINAQSASVQARLLEGFGLAQLGGPQAEVAEASAAMQAGITTRFETTDFAGITARIVNDPESPFTVLDMTIKPGFGAPAHISPTEDKLFIVIEGQLKYLVGDRIETAGPGARIQVPKGVTHGFTNTGTGDARHILVSTPRRHEEFFRDLDRIPIPREQHMDMLPAIAARNEQMIVGPLP